MTEYLTTKELATLLRIKERKVYDLASSGTVPCSKATGKLLFPRDAINDWLAQNSAGPGASNTKAIPNVFLGSHDPLLEWALRESLCGIATFFDGSSDGLNRFNNDEGIAAGIHLFDNTSNEWNINAVAEQFAAKPVVLVEWAKRSRGLIINSQLKKHVLKMTDLKNLKIAPRQPESGAQRLLLDLLEQANLSPEEVKFTQVARSESDAALMVHEGKADVAFGLSALASQYRLAFVPVINERFDLLIHRRAWFDTPMQTLLNFCQTTAFKSHARELAGYDITQQGSVHFNGP